MLLHFFLDSPLSTNLTNGMCICAILNYINNRPVYYDTQYSVYYDDDMFNMLACKLELNCCSHETVYTIHVKTITWNQGNLHFHIQLTTMCKVYQQLFYLWSQPVWLNELMQIVLIVVELFESQHICHL